LLVLNNYVKGWLTVFFLASCVSAKNHQITEAKIIEVQSQRYKGGQKGTPAGIKYRLFVISPGTQDEFKTLGFWVDDKFATAIAYRNKIGVNKTKFNKGDTLTVQANYIFSQNGIIMQDSSLKVIKPEQYNQKVTLLYTFNTKQKYIGFNQIKELEEELRP